MPNYRRLSFRFNKGAVCTILFRFDVCGTVTLSQEYSGKMCKRLIIFLFAIISQKLVLVNSAEPIQQLMCPNGLQFGSNPCRNQQFFNPTIQQPIAVAPTTTIQPTTDKSRPTDNPTDEPIQQLMCPSGLQLGSNPCRNQQFFNPTIQQPIAVPRVTTVPSTTDKSRQLVMKTTPKKPASSSAVTHKYEMNFFYVFLIIIVFLILSL